MTTIEVLSAALEFEKTHGIFPKRVTLNPADGDEMFKGIALPAILALTIPSDLRGMDWYKDETVPKGEIRFDTVE